MAVSSRLRFALAALVLAPAAAQAGPPPNKPAETVPAHPAHAKPPAGATAIKTASHRTASLAPAPQRAKLGQSIGSPTQGHLIGGAHVTESPYLRIVPVYVPGDARWGLESLVGLVDRSGKAVRKQFPDAVLSVGHLSRPGGGEIERHASHESGRDADLGFYIKNQAGKPIYADHFVPFLADGTAPSWPGARFDDARNWALVAAIVGDGHVHVTHIFVATPIRARLLAHAEKIGAPPNIRIRAAELMAQPKGALPHDDHFHVRIGCPSGMEQCIEQPLPRKHPHGALASSHPAPAPHAGAHPAQAPAHRPAASPSAGAAGGSADKPEPREKADEESAKSDSTPSLAPMVPGLDAAVIPTPLATPTPPAKKEAAPAPKADPIDDPDGVLEGR